MTGLKIELARKQGDDYVNPDTFKYAIFSTHTNIVDIIFAL